MLLQNGFNYRWPFTVFFSDHVYFSISLQFYLNVRSYNVLVHALVMQLRIALGWEPADSVWSSLGVAGATTLAIRGEDTASKGLPEDPWSLLECTTTRWFLTPAFVPKKRTTSGPLSSVQVIRMWWKQFQVFQQFCFSIKLLFKQFQDQKYFFPFLS